MAFQNARRKLEGLVEYPRELEIVVGEGSPYVGCRGKYVRAQDQDKANGFPIWAGVDSVMWIYSTPNGYWRVTDTTQDFADGLGYIISLEQHQGRPPEEMTGWCAGGDRDPTISVKHWVVRSPPAARKSSITTDRTVAIAVHKHPSQPLGITFKTPQLTVADIKPNSVADECGISQYKHWQLTHVNDTRIRTTKDLYEQTRGVAACRIRLSAPDEYSTVSSGWNGQDTKVWVSKDPDEPLGLQLEDMILVNVTHGSPSQRAGLATLLGCELVHVDGHAVEVVGDIAKHSAGSEGVWLGFLTPQISRKTSVASAGSSSPQRRGSAPIPIAIEVALLKTDGPLGCQFDTKSGELVLTDVNVDSPAGDVHMDVYVGRTLTAFGGKHVKTIQQVTNVWSTVKEGSHVTAVLEDRRFDEHFKQDRSYTGFLEAYGKWGDNEWQSARQTTLPAPSYQSWHDKRTEEARRASSPAQYNDPHPRDGTFTRRTLGLPAAASRPRQFNKLSAWSTSRPTFLGPGKS